MASYKLKTLIRELKSHGAILACIVALLWAIEAINFMLGGRLLQFGIVPRTLTGLRGILFAPFLHANFTHLIANTIPLVTLGWFVMLRRTGDFFLVSAIAMLIGGFGTWLVAPSNSVHIGASGVIFGYVGYLVSRGYFERSLVSLLASIAIAFLYGGLLWGVLPGQPGISWQGHFFGFIGGMIAAKVIAKK